MDSFLNLIDRLNDCFEAERDDIERRILGSYQRERAVLALDMSGFSLSVRRNGILNCLSRIRRMQQLTAPLLPKFHGELVKFEADNLLAVFDDVRNAVDAALAMNRAVSAYGQSVKDAVPLALGIGIDYGPLLLIPGKDCFGDAVNIAHKLGEDVAGPGEILITPAVRERLGNPLAYRLENLTLSISGLEISAYRVLQA
jgi:class 3 adenylate cyclase